MRDNGIPNIPGIKIGGVLDTYTRKQADERFQSTLSEEQLANIDDVPSKASKKELEAVRKALDGDKQDNLTPKQLAVLADIEKLDLMVQEEIGKINKETEESLEAVRTEGERVEDSLPDDYVALSETVSNTANAIKGFTNDNVVSLTDVSPIKHIMGVKVTGVDNPENVTVARYGKNIIGGNKDVSIPWGTANVDFDSNTQEFTINGTGSSTSNIAFENFGYKIYPV
ncbi:MAG: hypothetical protein IJ300_00790, partial [Clostridia bacterium]|nr:hypothetical protein [Clostridia bacterium]